MTASRPFSIFVFAICLAVPAMAQPAATATKPVSLAARVAALEKDNSALRGDIERLQTLLTQTRRDMLTMQGGRISGYVPGPAGAPTIAPLSVPAQQAQANAAIQNQGVSQQLNNLQLQQNMMQDRQREQQLFQPAPPFGTP
jgi:hypothetical protein